MERVSRDVLSYILKFLEFVDWYKMLYVSKHLHSTITKIFTALNLKRSINRSNDLRLHPLTAHVATWCLICHNFGIKRRSVFSTLLTTPFPYCIDNCYVCLKCRREVDYEIMYVYERIVCVKCATILRDTLYMKMMAISPLSYLP